MSIDELLARENIRDTIARYTIAGDRLRADDLAATFTEDGVLESDGVAEQDAFCYRGRQQIREWITRWTRPSADACSVPRATFVRHHLSTNLIDIVDADHAKARTYWVAYTDIGQDHCGYYVDTYRRIDGRWLIAHRKVRMDWRAANSLFVTAVSQSRQPK
jgi:hypothetical protein